MKKILGLGMVALLVMALVGGGTWAYFSDTETSSDNVLVAGTLNLGLANSSGSNPTGGASGTWSISTPPGWAPGNTVPGTLYVKNAGTLPMTSVNVTFSRLFTNNTPTTVNGWNGAANTDNMDKMVIAQVATWNGGAISGLQGATLETILAHGPYALGDGSLASGAENPLAITWQFLPSATNGCQGDSENITATIGASQ
jgi:spore coat-associated protein N